MKCVVCKVGETNPGTATLTLERGNLTLVVKHVPADVCDNCGEEFIDGRVARRLLEDAEAVSHQGVSVEVREYQPV